MLVVPKVFGNKTKFCRNSNFDLMIAFMVHSSTRVPTYIMVRAEAMTIPPISFETKFTLP